MVRVVSGFKKTKRSRRNGFALLAIIGKGLRRVLSYEVAKLPRFRKATLTPRPQQYLKRDIHRKRLNNPFTKEPVANKLWEQGVVAHRFGIASSMLVLVSGIWINVVFVKPTFYIDRIVVTGTQEIDPEELTNITKQHLARRSWIFVPRSHRWLMDLSTLRTAVLAQYDLDYLRLEPDWTAHTLEISLQEKPSLYIYAVSNRFFALDKEGSVIRELPAQPDMTSMDVPVLYEYDETRIPAVGDNALTPQCIASIRTLVEGFKAYPQVQIHSFRLRVSPQQEITIVDEPPQTSADKDKAQDKSDKALADAAQSIAHAQTIEEKVTELKDALKSLSIEKLEEGKLDQIIKDERVYKPTEGYVYKELELYTKQGWSIKIGHNVFDDATAAEQVLNIFATLEQNINLGEVREYIDLRIPNRVYYR